MVIVLMGWYLKTPLDVPSLSGFLRKSPQSWWNTDFFSCPQVHHGEFLMTNWFSECTLARWKSDQNIAKHMKVKQWWQAKLHHKVWPRPSRWTNSVSGSSTWSQLFDTKKWCASQEYFLKITYKQTNWSWKMSMCTLDSLESLKDFYNWPPALMPFRVLSSPKIKFLGQKTTPQKKSASWVLEA